MKIQYSHFRRPPPLNPARSPAEHGEWTILLNRFMGTLCRLPGRGVPVRANTRLRCIAVTTCEITPTGEEIFKPILGAAFCCAKDQFSRKIGRDISRGRAMALKAAGELR